jgi:hypothetical protein
MTEYRRDPETGAVYAFGGLSDLGGSIDAARADRDDFQRVLERRADITRHQLTFSDRRDLERTLGHHDTFDQMVRRRMRQLQTRVRPSVRRPVSGRAQITSGVQGLLVATEDFEYVDSLGHTVKVRRGRTHVAPKSEAHKARPSAFAA